MVSGDAVKIQLKSLQSKGSPVNSTPHTMNKIPHNTKLGSKGCGVSLTNHLYPKMPLNIYKFFDAEMRVS